MANDRVIMPYFTGYSSGLCHYWNCRFPLGLLAILLAIVRSVISSGQNVCGKVGAILGAWVGGMDAERIEGAAGMLPDVAPLIPMETQSPKQTDQTGLACWRNIQPNPFADDLGNFVLPRQPCPQVI